MAALPGRDHHEIADLKRPDRRNGRSSRNGGAPGETAVASVIAATTMLPVSVLLASAPAVAGETNAASTDTAAGTQQTQAAPHTAAPSVAPPEIPASTPVEFGRLLAQQRCSNCHALEETGNKSFAAPLNNLFGRQSGTAKGYFFTPNMKQLAVIWTPATLSQWLATTTFDTPDMRMRHVGLPEVRERQALISFLQTLEGNETKP